jgi:hypothetical protein
MALLERAGHTFRYVVPEVRAGRRGGAAHADAHHLARVRREPATRSS